MDLNIFIVLLFTLFAGGHSLKCYQCSNDTGSCAGVETTCNTTNTICSSSTTTGSLGNIISTIQSKDCDVTQNCGNGSFNFGNIRLAVSTQCCNTDLCNTNDVPVPSNSPNGKQCYYCDGKSCWNKLNCLGNEDSCITAKTNITDMPVSKGCITKSICDSASQVSQGLKDFTCCQGNLCNSAMSITQNLVFLSWPFFFYILIH